MKGPAMRPTDRKRLLAGEHPSPHEVLGIHAATVRKTPGVVVRAFHPDAASVELCRHGEPDLALAAEGDGLFSIFLGGVAPDLSYWLRFRFADGGTWERGDPYRFLPTLGELDLHLFNEGTHRRLWERLGARVVTQQGASGVAFAVWAPNARRVSVVGDFCNWDGRLLPMRQVGASGVYELFVPDVGAGAYYKYEILTREGALRPKTDPCAAAMEVPPGTASRVVGPSSHQWGDGEWMAARATRELRREPVLIYEVHLGSWARVPEDRNRSLTYREIAPRLAEHCRRLGFTHVEFLPLSEYPFEGSWGYQVSGYYAPSARFGTPDDFRALVDTLHQAGVGVILDWVPAHFPKDDFALRRFDGTALYEHEDPRRGEHPEWGTLIFNYGRPEVRSFLVSNACYWLREFHVDGLRVDAVASMLYLDYSRRQGEWLPNQYGGRENLEAVTFLQAMNEAVRAEAPGCFTVAEESTAWPAVTQPAQDGGLGFTFKWNMGWMHDTLEYFRLDPVHRRFHQNQLTFAMMYEHTERFVMPLSHDEVVHGKGSLYDKMPGDRWQKLANLKLLFTYQYTRPGKALLFMGSELAQEREWNHDASLDWHLLDEPARRAYFEYLGELGRLYRAEPALWRRDHDGDGFHWIDCSDAANSVVSYVRRDGEAHLVVVLNLTPVPRDGYRLGVPSGGTWVERLCSDARRFGGSEVETPPRLEAEPLGAHGYADSLVLRLPPLGALILAPA